MDSLQTSVNPSSGLGKAEIPWDVDACRVPAGLFYGLVLADPAGRSLPVGQA